jgi:hypothetical protein
MQSPLPLKRKQSLLLERQWVGELVADFLNGHPPTAIQHSIAQDHGVDLDSNLQAVVLDLLDNFPEYF